MSYRMALGAMEDVQGTPEGVFTETLSSHGQLNFQLIGFQIGYMFTEHTGLELQAPLFIKRPVSDARNNLQNWYLAQESSDYLAIDSRFHRNFSGNNVINGQLSLELVQRYQLGNWVLSGGLGGGFIFISSARQSFAIKEVGSHQTYEIDISTPSSIRAYPTAVSSVEISHKVLPAIEISLALHGRYFRYEESFTETRRDVITDIQSISSIDYDTQVWSAGFSLGMRFILNEINSSMFDFLRP